MSARARAYSEDLSDDYGESAATTTTTTTTTATANTATAATTVAKKKHTQFLDLTNGEGGEGPSSSSSALAHNPQNHDHHHQQQHHDDDDDDDEDDDDDRGGGGRGSVAIGFDPSTPGRVVDQGQEMTGRWTKEEHEAFLAALRMYGKEWKKVAAKVKTRTVVQTRTHAQKYFQKLQKTMVQAGMSGKDVEVPFVEMGVSSETKKTSKKKSRIAAAVEKATAEMSLATSSSAAAAPPPSLATIPTLKVNRRSSSATLSAAQVISNLSQRTGPYVATSSSAIMSGAAGGADVVQPQQPRHGFSTETAEPTTTAGASGGGMATGTAVSTSRPGGNGSSSSNFESWMSNVSMKITAPDPNDTMKKGKFPEPSPAATGKRKLAEIAAARMLAGVAVAPPASAASSSGNERTSNGGGATADTDGAYEFEGPPTPPPPDAPKNLKDAPPPPLFAGGVLSRDDNVIKRPKGLPSLQIVNPETLGITYKEKRKRGADGETSPVTPWDGELQELVSKKARLEERQEDDLYRTSYHEGDSSNNQDDDYDDGGGSSTDKRTTAKRALHPVCGPPTAYARTLLHRSVCSMDLSRLQEQLSVLANRGEGILERLDEAGYAPLHSACALCLSRAEHAETSREMVRTLLLAGANAMRADQNGNTPLHWAARAGNKNVITQLLVKNAALDATNAAGETPLHWAMRTGRRGMGAVQALLENGSRASVLDSYYRRPLDVAVEGFLDEEHSVAAIRVRDIQQQQQHGKKPSRELKKAVKETLTERQECRQNMLMHSSQSRSLVLHHPECLEHHPKSSADWECPDRIRSILGRIVPPDNATDSRAIYPHEITVSKEFDRANLNILNRVHSTEYLSFVNQLSKDLEKQIKDAGNASADDSDGGIGTSPPVVPFTPLVQKSIVKFEKTAIKQGANSDTSFSAGSLRAARRAAGAVQHAVDCVLVGRSRNAFCVVRPPGHHAGVNGLLEGGESCGFCIFNNVAAGALYAISDDRLLCERCAIVDIDVHHGNGTEEIVRNYHDPSKLFFFSIHLYDNDKRKRTGNSFPYKFYPGTGSEDDLALNIINVPIVPLWKENAPAAPVRTHNTRHKARNSQESQDDSSEAGTPKGSDNASDSGSTAAGGIAAGVAAAAGGGGGGTAPAMQSGVAGRMAYRQAILSRLLPALRAFNPDLILISAGFDACKDDVGNARHERGGQRMGLDLDPEDYAWTTRKILEIADICCQGRVVSVLEGGYGRTPPRVLPGEDDERLDRTMFAECAVRHLHAMVDPYNTEGRFSSPL